MHPRSPDPTGWYAVGTAHELAPGEVQSHTIFGQDVAVFRTASGTLGVLRAACPHLGGHLGDGGVRGEALHCPFHDFGFGVDGTCRSTPAGRPARGTTAGQLPVRERNGLILVWWDRAGRPPAWEVPEHGRCFTRPKLATVTFPGHPADTTENAVDVLHFKTVHGFHEVRFEGLTVDGPHLAADYTFVHTLGPVAWNVRFTAHCWGLGYSFVAVELPAVGLRTRLFVLATPKADGVLTLRLGAAGPDDGTRVGRALGAVVRAASLALLRRDAAQDIPLWSRRTHILRPALARGDGPIGRYRRWAAQFEPDARALRAMGA